MTVKQPADLELAKLVTTSANAADQLRETTNFNLNLYRFTDDPSLKTHEEIVLLSNVRGRLSGGLHDIWLVRDMCKFPPPELSMLSHVRRTLLTVLEEEIGR